MKTFKTIFSAFTALASIAAVSCNKAYEVVDPDFDVTAPITVKVGEKVPFKMTGTADVISFFSGETGHKYELSREERIVPCDTMYFSFSTRTNKSNPVDEDPNPYTIPLSYSTDFSGVYVKSRMEEATWNDITDRFTYATKRNQTTAIPTGLVNVDDIFESSDDPIYFRWFFRVEADIPKNSNQRTQWWTQAMNFQTIIDGQTYTVFDIFDMAWTFIPGMNYNTVTGTNGPVYPAKDNVDYIQFKTQASPTEPIEFWFISGPIYKKDFNMGKDYPIAIKATADPKLESYGYSYSEPGTYTATFVAANTNYRGRKEVVKSVTFTVVKDEGSIGGFENGEWK